MRATRWTCMALLAAVGGWFSLGSAMAAAPYFITVVGQPAIVCSNTGVAITGVSLQWQLKSVTSAADGNLYINGGAPIVGTLAPGTFPGGGASGTYGLSGANLVYPSTPYPYTLKFDVVPQESYTDGVSVSFKCLSGSATGGFSDWSVTTIPARVPAFSASPSTVNFPATAVDASSAATTVTVTNNGTADASAMSITGSNWVDFAIGSNTCTGPLARNASCSFAATFAPRARRALSAAAGRRRRGRVHVGAVEGHRHGRRTAQHAASSCSGRRPWARPALRPA